MFQPLISTNNRKAHATVLEERLQQTLEREAALNEEVEALRNAARDCERRVARAEADAARVGAAAKAQVDYSISQRGGGGERGGEGVYS